MKKYLDTKEQIDWEEVPQDDIVEEEWKPEAPEIQRFVWNLFEHPHTSIAARIVGCRCVCVLGGASMHQM